MNSKYNVKQDLYYVIDYFFLGTHYPFYVKKYSKLMVTGDMETRIAYGVEQTNRTR